MSYGLDQGLAGGALIGSALAAFFSRRTHGQIKVPHERDDVFPTPTAGALLEQVAVSQQETAAVLVAHIAEDEAFKTEVRGVLNLRPIARRRAR